MSRVIDCACGHQLRAEDEAALFRATRDHADRVHPDMKLTDNQLRDMITVEAYHEGPLSDKNALALVRRAFRDVWEQGDLNAADAVYAREYVNHDPSSPEVPPGPAGVRENVIMYRTAFPDHKFTLDDTIVAGDRVVVRWSVTATHQGALRGILPTGKRVSTSGISLFRIAGGKIAEGWVNWDTLGLMQQIGAVPAMAGAGK